MVGTIGNASQIINVNIIFRRGDVKRGSGGARVPLPGAHLTCRALQPAYVLTEDTQH